MPGTYGPEVYRDQGGDRITIGPGGILRVQGTVLGATPGTDYYVDETDGSDSNDGFSWADSFASITTAFTAAAALGATTVYRKLVRIFVAAEGYAEDLVTPLNTECPFGQLIGVSPTRRSVGGVWLTSATASEPILTIRARGWGVYGFEFDAPSSDGCILLDSVTANANAKFAEIANNLFVGSHAADFGIDTNEANPLVVIRDNMFIGLGGRAITSTDCYALQWEIANNWFENCANYIAPKNSKGMQQAWIHDNNFNHISGDYTATIKIDMRGGAQNHIGPNNFLGNTYDNAGGYYASSTDTWRGNHSQDSDSGTTGTGQVNPAA